MRKRRAILIGTVIFFFSACSGPSSDTPKSSAKSITGFSITIPSIEGTIDETARTISLTVPWSTPLTSLMPAIVHTGASLSPSSLAAQDFTNPVTYTVTAADSSTQAYTVTVSVASDSDKDITSFGFINPAATGTVNTETGTIAVTIPSGLPPFGIDVRSLVAHFSATGISVRVGTASQISGITKNDFSSPVTYTVTAQDSSEKNFVVTVSRSAFKAFAGTSTVSTIAGLSTGGAGAAGSADGSGTAARFNGPSGIATDGKNIFIADTLNNTIRKIVIATGDVTTIAGSAGTGTGPSTVTAALFNSPKGITTDGTNLFVADTLNNTIRKIVIATGMITTIAGSAGTGSATGAGSADGTGTAARFNGPLGIANDGTYLYVADTGNNSVRRIGISTGIVETMTLAVTLNQPEGIATDGRNLYVSESGLQVIRKIDISTGSTGSTVPLATTVLAGTPGLTGNSDSTDGTGVTARFNHPAGLSTDGRYVYAADVNNNLIRRIRTSNGVVTTVVVATSGLNQPWGIANDGLALYVTDGGNNIIRKIE